MIRLKNAHAAVIRGLTITGSLLLRMVWNEPQNTRTASARLKRAIVRNSWIEFSLHFDCPYGRQFEPCLDESHNEIDQCIKQVIVCFGAKPE